MSELKPCPFCGGEAEAHEVTFPYHYWDVLCDGECFDHFCEKPTKAEAIAAWNTRADDYRHAAEYWQRMYEESFTERTCRSTTDDAAWCFVCSECGKSFPRDKLHLAYHHGEINYCPNCGAKVVSE